MTVDALTYYATHGAALFPIPAGQKAPFGVVKSFKHDSSTSPEQWETWRNSHPNCNFGVVGFASNWIIVDIDTSGGEQGRAEAWALWADLCRSWGLPGPLSPHCQSQSGGWHCYLQVPPHIDASTLRQPDAIKKRINVRCVGYTVAAGSQFEGRPYTLFPDAPAPYPAPAALVAHCTRAAPRPLSNSVTGSRDKDDVAALLLWLNERDVFAPYEDYCAIGMALKLEYGDDGFELWETVFDGTVTPSDASTKWESFSSEPTSDSVTLATFLQRAHSLGWHGSVRKSTAAMFDGVAQLAAASGASLHGGGPLPMLAGQVELTRLATPILQEFLDATTDSANWPNSADFPTLPIAMEGHGVFALMQDCISRIVALAEVEGKWKPARVTAPFAVLSVLHGDVFTALCRRIETMGHTLHTSKIKLAANALSDNVQRAFVSQDDWIYDARSGLPEHDNPDNFVVFLGIIDCEVRWNAWLERMEIRGGNDADLSWKNWTYIDDTAIVKLRMRALRAKTRFKIGKEFAWEALLDLAHKNTVDPVCELLTSLQESWDGTKRLSNWLAMTCGTPDDAYHRAVSELIIGGMVRRIRQPGCKNDLMPVFYGPQGTGKSTIAKIIADMGQSTLAQIDKRSTPHFSDEVMLGDESKELVLSLAGKCLVEIGEMGQRNSAKIDHVKAMLSRQVDRGRTAYSRSVTERPRRNVFFGTVNGDQPLSDESGNRRFLPISVPAELNLSWLSDHIRQIVAEAAVMEAAGADFSLPREVWAVATEKQEAARAQSDFEVHLAGWFSESGSGYIASHDLAALLKDATGRSVPPNQYGKAMTRLGFVSRTKRIDGTPVAAWHRADGTQRITVSRDASGRMSPRQMFGAVVALAR